MTAPPGVARATVPRLLVLAELAAAGPGGLSGAELITALRLRGNTVYPLLERLREERLVAPAPPRPRAGTGAPAQPLALTVAGRAALAHAAAWATQQHHVAVRRAAALDRALSRVAALGPVLGAV